MHYKLTPKGETYRIILLKQISLFQEKFSTAQARRVLKPKWNYPLGQRAYILDAIYTGTDIKADIERTVSYLIEQKWPGRAKVYRKTIERNLDELIVLGYVTHDQ